MAEFKAAAIFSNNIVLKSEKTVLIFDTGEENTLITAHIDGIKASGRVRDRK